MQDEYGRPLSDDGQWVWDGSAWHAHGRRAGRARSRLRVAYRADPGRARSSYRSRPDYFTAARRPGLRSCGRRPHHAVVEAAGGHHRRAAGPVGGIGHDHPADARRRLGLHAYPDPERHRYAVRRSDDASPSPAPTSSALFAAAERRAANPDPADAHRAPARSSGGIYDCTQGGRVDRSDHQLLRADLHHQLRCGRHLHYDADLGSDLLHRRGSGPYTGTYNASGPSMDIQTAGISLHCAQ